MSKSFMSRREFLRLTTVASAAAALAACAPAPTPVAPAAGQTSQTAAAPAVKDMDVLKIGIAAMQQQFDPGYSIGIQSIKVFYNMFDTLLHTDKDGKIVGQLATKWEWKDEKTLNVTIRKGVTFHNGEPCTSEDVKFTFDRILSKYGDGTIAVLYESLDSVEIVDDVTVQFKTKFVDAAFLDRLGSIWGTHIVPKDYVKQIGDEAFKTQPIGTGPFAMTSYSPEKIILKRYDGFWGDKPHVKEIDFIIMPETSARVAALLTGEVDIINDVTKDLVDRIKTTKGMNVVGTQVKNIHTYVLKTTNGPMKNQKFRQALTMAINRQQLVDTLWSTYAAVPNGHQFKAYGDMYIQEYPTIKFDLEKAKQLVTESGYDGTEIELELNPGYYLNGNQAAEAVVDTWNKIGVKAKVIYNAKVTFESFKHVRPWSSASRFDDPLGALWLLFGTGSTVEKNSWLDMPADWKKMGEQLKTTTDVAARRKMCAEFLKMFDDYAPGTYLYVVEDLYGMRDGLDWGMYYAENQIMPFRADDFKLKS